MQRLYIRLTKRTEVGKRDTFNRELIEEALKNYTKVKQTKSRRLTLGPGAPGGPYNTKKKKKKNNKYLVDISNQAGT